MRFIVPGNKNIQRLLSSIQVESKSLYVLSNFLLRQDTEDGVLLCNTLTGEMALLTIEDMQALEQTPIHPSENVNELIRHRFLVPQGCREAEAADQLRNLLLKRREAKKDIYNYVILPTTFCNARCFYCYESGIRHVHMSEDTAKQLVEFIATHHGDNIVNLSWFGGEPLIGKQRIDQICDDLEKRMITFSSTMTSNGFLFDVELVKHAKKAWNLKSVQITMDGTEEIYNRTKAYVTTDVNPYQKVLRNINFLLEAGIQVNIRLNLDSHNVKDVAELIDYLSERFQSNNFFMYVSRLNEEVGFAPIHRNTEDKEQLYKALKQIRSLLEKKGWPQFRADKLPYMQTFYCIAEDPCSVLCTPDGVLGKCLDHIYEDTVGSLTEGVSDKEKINWWRQRAIRHGCDICPLYPFCNNLLLHCPMREEECYAEMREYKMAGFRAIMLREYEKWKKNEKKE